MAGDTVETVHRTCAHLMAGADYRGRAAMDEFFERAGDEGSAPDVPSDEATVPVFLGLTRVVRPDDPKLSRGRAARPGGRRPAEIVGGC